MTTKATTAALRAKLNAQPAQLFEPTAFLGRNNDCVPWINSKVFGRARGISVTAALDILDHTDELLAAVAAAVELAEDPETLEQLKAAKEGKTTATAKKDDAPAQESTADRLARLRGAAKA